MSSTKKYSKKTPAKKTSNYKSSSYSRSYPVRRTYAPRTTRTYRKRVTTTPTQGGMNFSNAGAALGTVLGGPAGGAVGKLIGMAGDTLHSFITGQGDYTVSSNTLCEGGVSPPVMLASKNNGSVILRHREFIADITGSIDFKLQSYDINAGLSSTFPWLAGTASNFEEYRVHGMVFEFKSTSSDAILSSATNSALGTVIMATQYNSLSLPFPDKKTMENYEFANSSKPSVSFYHPIECKSELNPLHELYIRTNDSFPGDQRLYDLGAFQIACQGQQANGGTIGELWCTFEIELFKPKYTVNSDVFSDHFNLATINATAPLGLTTATYTGTLRTLSSSPNWNNNGTISSDGRTYTFPLSVVNGTFLFNWTISGTTSGSMVYPILTYSNCAPIQIFKGDTANVWSASTVNTTINMGYLFALKISGPSATVTFGISGTFPNAPINGDLFVTQISDLILS